jgi:hypothetical protein
MEGAGAMKFGFEIKMVREDGARVYAANVVVAAVDKYQELIKAKRAFGMMGHGDDASINVGRISHRITKLEASPDDGQSFSGEGETTDTYFGEVAVHLLLDDCRSCGKTFGFKGGNRESKCPYCGAILPVKLDPNITISPSGVGTVNDAGEVSDYSIIALNFILGNEVTVKSVLRVLD